MARPPEITTPKVTLSLQVIPDIKEQMVALMAKDPERWPSLSAIGVDAINAYLKRYGD